MGPSAEAEKIHICMMEKAKCWVEGGYRDVWELHECVDTRVTLDTRLPEDDTGIGKSISF